MLKMRFSITTLALISIALTSVASSDAAVPDKGGRSGSWKQSSQGSPSLANCQKAVEKNPGNAIANNDLGWAYRQHGDTAKAEKYLRDAIKIDAKLPEPHCNLSVVLLDTGKTDEALEQARAAVVAGPNNAVCHVVLGNALDKKGDAKAAIEEYRAALKLQADYENALYHLGRMLVSTGDKAEAKSVLSQALGLDPKDDRVVALLDKLID